MDIRIYPAKLRGTVQAPESKSQAHRLLIAAFLANRAGGNCSVKINNMSEDIKATMRCLDALGSGADLPELFCGESGSTLRFMLPLSAICGEGAVFFGGGKLPKRPLAPLDEQMRLHGVRVEPAAGYIPSGEAASEETSGQVPIVKTEGRLRGGVFELPGNVSSQYLTALLMALPLAEEDSRITLTSPLESAGYVEMTLDVLRSFEITVLREGDTYYIKGGQRYIPPARELTVEGDWSNAAFWLVADRITAAGGAEETGAAGSCVIVEGLDTDSTQGDKAILDIIEPMIGPLIIDASQVPDLVPIACVYGTVMNRNTMISHGERLRLKESDRIETTCSMLDALGTDSNEVLDIVLIHGQERLTGGEVDGAGDHRIVMAAAIAACACEGPVTIRGAEAVEKSYPGFFDDYRKLGGKVEILG